MTTRGTHRPSTVNFARDDITDITVGFGQRYGFQLFPKYGAWLIIDGPVRIECLHRFGGDEVARAADALRAAMGMPKRSWP